MNCAWEMSLPAMASASFDRDDPGAATMEMSSMSSSALSADLLFEVGSAAPRPSYSAYFRLAAVGTARENEVE